MQFIHIMYARVAQHSKSINKSYHISKLKEKNHMIRLIVSKKALDKIQHSFMTQTFSK